MSDLISIKGGRDGLLLRLDAEADWSQLLTHLAIQLEERSSFFAGAQLTLDVGDRVMNDVQLAEMLELMRRHGVAASAIDASQRSSRSAARNIGLPARPLPRYSDSPAETRNEPEATLLVRTIRSGQVVRHHGHITLIGDLNPGAELIAGGSVIVWGRLRGLVHAGALGDSGALICAIELRPTQLRIADQIATPPRGQASSHPEVARIHGESIMVEPWETFKR